MNDTELNIERAFAGAGLGGESGAIGGALIFMIIGAIASIAFLVLWIYHLFCGNQELVGGFSGTFKRCFECLKTKDKPKKQKLTPAQIAEKQEIIKQKYEEDVKEKEQQILNLQNKLTDKDNEIFELQKTNQNLAQDRDE
ncbi:9375_t:CDS:2 [Entrophospora sp. SA101]|nr:9375_t:CDS:2 [Entrophospora sp. SA101]